MTEIPKAYNPKTVETQWYEAWLNGSYFHAATDPRDPRFCIVIPPPNITGSLHLGHALNNTLQDVLVRWKRMQHYNTLWLPGTDHAGIATQNVVEQQIRTKGKNREDLGRQKFIERVWQWREQSGRTIIDQLKRLGASCDWVRERFTLDEGLSAAVREVFVRLHEEGLIYRGERLINWCPRCQTALSDIEVEHEENLGKMFYINYPLADEPDLFLTVGTTRPETMLGDTAVAVHPEDPRYNKLIGREVLLPLTHRKIPIVGDPVLVDREFGTGAVKITPAHDFNDFEAGERHHLPRISILNKKAQILTSLEEHGVDKEVFNDIRLTDVSKAREHVVQWLEQRGHLVKQEAYQYAVGQCYRCKSVVEPFLSPQWFVKIKPLAEPAIEAVKSGQIRFIPEGWENSYFAWMEIIKDWCISRQIWWGHQIPAWYCSQCNSGALLQTDSADFPLISQEAKPIVSRTPPTQCPTCEGSDLIQDPDVLDTWFSSALWPFSTLGWPKETAELKLFYPTDTLVTSFDILFFWVARMIMMGLKFRGEVPFRNVYIHALVRDAEGQKMSKSKGNVIDPLEVMDKYGTDALRFTLAAMASPGRDIKLSEQRIEGYRNFANKIWNAGRFILLNCPEGFEPVRFDDPKQLSLVSRWWLSRLQQCIRSVNGSLEAYRFDEASHYLYQFIWHEFCDWYLEFSKVDLADPDKKNQTISILLTSFETLLRLLHPVMPFITEELWQKLPPPCRTVRNGKETVMLSPYPQPRSEFEDGELETQVQKVLDVITQIRKFWSEMKIAPAHRLRCAFRVHREDLAELYQRYNRYIQSTARLSELKIGAQTQKPSDSVSLHVEDGEVYLSLTGILNMEQDKKRIQKEIAKMESEISKVELKLKDPKFRNRAPQEVVGKEEARRNELNERRLHLYHYYEQLKEIK
jgi:valyl-tRNA synthetase